MDATAITILQIVEDQIQIMNVGAIPGSDAFLIWNRERAVLIDSGFSFCAHQMIANIKEVLREMGLEFS